MIDKFGTYHVCVAPNGVQGRVIAPNGVPVFISLT